MGDGRQNLPRKDKKRSSGAFAECFQRFEIVVVVMISRTVSLRSSMDFQSSVSDEFRRFPEQCL